MNTVEIDHVTPSPSPAPTMRALVQRRYGTDPEAVLDVTDVATPDITPDEILVRVAAAGVDMGTWHCMTGLPYAMRAFGFGFRAPKAMNPGRSFAGTVELVGDHVVGFAPGDEVYGTCDGSFAELVRAQPGMVARKPSNLTFEQAASAPISGGTALQAVRRAAIVAGERVLIVGASGGVGSFAVQIAKARGAEVTGVCSTAKVDLVRSLGADHVIDYSVDDIDVAGVEYDVILDIGGNRSLSELRRVLTRSGRLVIVGGETDGRLLGGFGRSLRAVAVSPFVPQTLGMLASTETAEDLDLLRELIEDGLVTPAVDRVFPLDDAASAIAEQRDGRVRGKVVIAI
jgi:NADPH:quinone reductase-like Zn-dependent oxidoreductase